MRGPIYHSSQPSPNNNPAPARKQLAINTNQIEAAVVSSNHPGSPSCSIHTTRSSVCLSPKLILSSPKPQSALPELPSEVGEEEVDDLLAWASNLGGGTSPSATQS